jgi:hypothetical protein
MPVGSGSEGSGIPPTTGIELSAVQLLIPFAVLIPLAVLLLPSLPLAELPPPFEPWLLWLPWLPWLVPRVPAAP